MVYNEHDDILFWEDIKPYQEFMQKLDEKYGLNTPNPVGTISDAEYEKLCSERDAFYLQTIPTKEEFIRRFQHYALHGKPLWIDGPHKTISELTEEEWLKSYHHALDETGVRRVEITENARNGWAAKHLSHYADKICTKTTSPHKIMEMTVGAGVGTNAIVRSLTEDMYYIGVDIDFVCAKNADVIGRYYRKNALGLCASLWNLPFSDNLFDVVCSHFGFDECREIPTILKEAVRVLKPGGKLITVSRHSAWLRRHKIFETYDIPEAQALELMRQVRLYADFEQFDALAVEAGLTRTDYIPFENWYLAEYIKL